MKEPSVLDYLKSKINPWQSEKIELAESETPPMSSDAIPPTDEGGTPKARISFQMPKSIPWRTILALVYLLAAVFVSDSVGILTPFAWAVKSAMVVVYSILAIIMFLKPSPSKAMAGGSGSA